jgi:hypothetical protein
MALAIVQIKASVLELRTGVRLNGLGKATISGERAGTTTATCSNVTRSLAMPYSVNAALDMVTLLRLVVYPKVSRGSTAMATFRRNVPTRWVRESHLPG